MARIRFIGLLIAIGGLWILTNSSVLGSAPSAEINTVSPNPANQNYFTPVDSNTVGYWTFDEGSGNIAYDRTDLNNDGSLKNNPSWVNGYESQAIELDGDSNYIEIPDSNNLEPSKLTIEAWIYPHSIKATKMLNIVSKAYNTNGPKYYSYVLSISDDRSIKVAISTDSQHTLSSNIKVSLNKWSHVAMTYDGSTVIIFVNGEQAGSMSVSGNIQYSSYPVNIGKWENSNNQDFDGKIDEVRISKINRPISDLLYQEFNSEILFIGTGNDSDGYLVNYEWKSDIDGGLSNNERFIIPASDLTSGIHTIEFRVKDNDNNWSPWVNTTLKINYNFWAEIVSISPSISLKGDTISFVGSEFGNDITNYLWRSSIDGILSNNKVFTENTLSEGAHTIYFKVQNGTGRWSDERSASIIVASKPIAIVDSINPSPAHNIVSNPVYEDTIAYWNFNEGVGNILTDSSSNKLNGIIQVQPAWTEGVEGTSLDFDGRNDYVKIPDNMKLRPDEFTIEAYIYPHSVKSEKHLNIVSKCYLLEGSRYYSFLLGILDDQRIQAVISTDQVYELKSLSPVNLNEWSHVAMTFDGSYLKVFINGNIQGTLSTTSYIRYSNYPVNIGKWEKTKNQNFDGMIDQVRISSNALDPSFFIIDNNGRIDIEGHGDSSVGVIMNYEWESSQNGIISLLNKDTISTNDLSVGTHNISFRVQSEYGYWSDLVYQDIYINQIPSAFIDSISPLPTNLGAEIQFNGSGIDNDGNIIKYEWISSIEGVIGEGSKLTARLFTPGDHFIFLRVKDDNNAWSYKDAELLTIPSPPPPIAYIDELTPVNELDPRAPYAQEMGKPVYLSGHGMSEGGTIEAYQWSSSVDGIFSTTANLTTTNLEWGLHDIEFNVQDSYGNWAEEPATTTLWVYTRPVANAGLNFLSTAGLILAVEGRGSDEDGQIVRYEWDLDGDGEYEVDLGAANGTLITTFDQVGNHTLRLRVTDNDGFTAVDELTISVQAAQPLPDQSLPAPGFIPFLGSIGLALVVVASFRGDGKRRYRGGR